MIKERGLIMVLLIDTTHDKKGKQLALDLATRSVGNACEYINAADMNISHCRGCNYCWLKTPGECVIRDEFEPLLKKIWVADQVWLITDTRFGFVSYQTKNIVDRLMPLVTMNLHFVDKQMRHVARYKKNPDWGLFYYGEADKEFLSHWCERLAINFSARSLGAYRESEQWEAVQCM